MAKPKTMIIYALGASVASIAAAIAPARERGQAVRIIALEEFRGETEQNAGAVYVERNGGDELVFDRIQQAYPAIEVQDWGGGVDVDDHASFAEKPADQTIKDLRVQLIALGGSAPAGADAAKLADLIAAYKAENNLNPNMPSPASQGTVIPDSTPIVQRPDGDKLVDPTATGTTAEALRVAEEQSGEGATQGGTPGSASPSTTAGTSDAPNSTDGSGDDGDAPTESQLMSKSKPELLKLAKGTDATEDNNKSEIVAKIIAARG